MIFKRTISRMLGTINIGVWKCSDDGLYNGLIKEFNIWANSETLYGLFNELNLSLDAYLTGFIELYREIGDKAVFFNNIDDKDWKYNNSIKAMVECEIITRKSYNTIKNDAPINKNRIIQVLGHENNRKIHIISIENPL